jgi:hypothetical protein
MYVTMQEEFMEMKHAYDDVNLHTECVDKKSNHYFMCHMTQEEFNDLKKDIEIKPYEFNRIKK